MLLPLLMGILMAHQSLVVKAIGSVNLSPSVQARSTCDAPVGCDTRPTDAEDLPPAWIDQIESIVTASIPEIKAQCVTPAAADEVPAAADQVAAGGVSVWTNIGCGLGATIDAGSAMLVYLQAGQSGPAELVSHRPDGQDVIWTGNLVAGQALTVRVVINAASYGGTRVLRLRMASAQAQDFCGFTIRVRSNVLCGWVRPASGWCAGSTASTVLTSCGDGREYLMAAPPVSCAPSTGYYVFWNPQFYWNSMCQQNVLYGYGRAACLGASGSGASCGNCPSGALAGTVNIWTNNGSYYGCDGTYRSGETIAIYLRAAQSGHAEVYNYWSDGQNKAINVGYLQAGLTYRILDTVHAPAGRHVLLLVMRGSLAMDYCSYMVANGAGGSGGITTYNGRLGAFVQVFDACSYFPLLDCDGNVIVELGGSSSFVSLVGRYVSVQAQIDTCGFGIAGQPLFGPVITEIHEIGDPCNRATGCNPNLRLRAPFQPVAGRAFTVEVSGESTNTCTPQYVGNTVLGNRIIVDEINTACGNFCLQSLTPYAYTIRIRPLAAGSYTMVIRSWCGNDYFDCTGPTISIPSLLTIPSESDGPAQTDDVDLGFRPDPNGFGFANRQLSREPAMFDQAFGLERTWCRAARKFYGIAYRDVSGGWSSLGFSAASMLAYLGWSQPGAGGFAIRKTPSLKEATDTQAITNAIAYYSGVQLSKQMLAAYQIAQFDCSKEGVSAILDRVRVGLQGTKPVLLALRYAGGTDGYHVVVPYHIEDVGPDFVEIYVYDSDTPKLERVIHLERSEGAWGWSYYFLGQLRGYAMAMAGCADMMALPLEALKEPLDPPVAFCLSDSGRSSGDAPARTLVQVWPEGLIRDPDGKEVGVVDGKNVERNSAAMVLPRIGGSDSADSHMIAAPPADYTIDFGKASVTTLRAAAFANGRSLEIVEQTKSGQYGSPVQTTSGLDFAAILNPAGLTGFAIEMSRDWMGEDRLAAAETVYSDGTGSLEQRFDGSALTLSRDKGTLRFRARFEAGRRPDNVFVSDLIDMAANETHRLTPLDWSNLARGFVLDIDRGRDGTNDERRRVGALDPHYSAIYLPRVVVNKSLPDQPDLALYRPSDWDEPVVLSDVPGGHQSTALRADASSYIDLAVRNDSDATIGEAFLLEILLDGQRLSATEFLSGSLTPGQWAELTDQSVTVAAGWHTLRVVVDPRNDVPESDESNNVWEKQYFWMDGHPTPVPTAPIAVGDSGE